MVQISQLNISLDITMMDIYLLDIIIRPLCTKLPQMIEYVKCFDSNQTMSFKLTTKKLLENYTQIRRKSAI